MMSSIDRFKKLEFLYIDYLKKASAHLEYSLIKSQTLPKDIEENSEEDLEVWESLTARFARVIDIFLTKFLKVAIKGQDPIFDGTLRDYLNLAEKMHLINNVDHWLSLRELRNIQAHDYTNETFHRFVSAIQLESAFVLQEMKRLKIYATENK